MVKYFSQADHIIFADALQVFAGHHFFDRVAKDVDHGRTNIGEVCITIVDGDNFGCMFQHQVEPFVGLTCLGNFTLQLDIGVFQILLSQGHLMSILL